MKPITKYSSRKRTAREKESGRVPLGGCRINTRMIYLLYDDGSRSERVILNELGSCKGIIQSDGYSPYRSSKRCLSNITRIPCLQHIKRKFIDCGEKEPDAKRIVELINALYQNEHKHKVGVEGWTVEQNLMHPEKVCAGHTRRNKRCA